MSLIWFNLITVWQICPSLVGPAVPALYILVGSQEMHSRFLHADLPETSDVYKLFSAKKYIFLIIFK